jgi:hypothetical protein
MKRVLDRRLDRLECPSGRPELVDFAELLQAAREHWRDDPDGAKRDDEKRRRNFIGECDSALATRRSLSAVAIGLMHAYRREEGGRVTVVSA